MIRFEHINVRNQSAAEKQNLNAQVETSSNSTFNLHECSPKMENNRETSSMVNIYLYFLSLNIIFFMFFQFVFSMNNILNINDILR